MITPHDMVYGTDRRYAQPRGRNYYNGQNRNHDDYNGREFRGASHEIAEVGKVAVTGIVTAGTIGIMGGLLGGIQK